METRERILQASHELLYKFGVRSVTMDDIAKEIGISKKTIYTCFSDKNELVTQFMQDKLNEHQQSFEYIIQTSANAIDEIFKSMHEMGHVFSRINPNFIYDIQKHHPSAWQLSVPVSLVWSWVASGAGWAARSPSLKLRLAL